MIWLHCLFARHGEYICTKVRLSEGDADDVVCKIFQAAPNLPAKIDARAAELRSQRRKPRAKRYRLAKERPKTTKVHPSCFRASGFQSLLLVAWAASLHSGRLRQGQLRHLLGSQARRSAEPRWRHKSSGRLQMWLGNSAHLSYFLALSLCWRSCNWGNRRSCC